MKNNALHSHGILSRMLYGMAEFFGGGAFVIINTFFIVFLTTAKEFAIVQKEIARRKGEDTSSITPEEIAVCEKVTGLSYSQLWNKENASHFRTR